MLFLYFLGIRKPSTDPTRPTDKKEGHEIDWFKGYLSKNTEFQKISRFQLRDDIKSEFPDSDFYWIGHYAARNNTLAKHFDAAVKDAQIFSDTSL